MDYYRAVRQLTAADAAYIAGLVDGEGTVTLTTMHRGDNRPLVVSISNTERGLLEFAQAALGAGQITGKRTYNVKHTPSFAFRVTSRQAVELLRQVAPYLRSYEAVRSCAPPAPKRRAESPPAFCFLPLGGRRPEDQAWLMRNQTSPTRSKLEQRSSACAEFL